MSYSHSFQRNKDCPRQIYKNRKPLEINGKAYWVLTYIFSNIITPFLEKVQLNKLFAEFLSGKIAAMRRL